MCPTRELAIQLRRYRKIGTFQGIRSPPIYGGQDVKQIRSLNKNYYWYTFVDH
jgi:superfamily II DNA/RNA helicase